MTPPIYVRVLAPVQSRVVATVRVEPTVPESSCATCQLLLDSLSKVKSVMAAKGKLSERNGKTDDQNEKVQSDPGPSTDHPRRRLVDDVRAENVLRAQPVQRRRLFHTFKLSLHSVLYRPFTPKIV